MARAMTKSEFTSAARKAGVNPNIYGLIIDRNLCARGGRHVTNGKVVGIEWFDEWKTEKEYSPGRGEYDNTFLSKVPYVILKKGKDTYCVDVCHINVYLRNMLDACIISKVKAQKEQKKG